MTGVVYSSMVISSCGLQIHSFPYHSSSSHISLLRRCLSLSVDDVISPQNDKTIPWCHSAVHRCFTALFGVVSRSLRFASCKPICHQTQDARLARLLSLSPQVWQLRWGLFCFHCLFSRTSVTHPTATVSLRANLHALIECPTPSVEFDPTAFSAAIAGRDYLYTDYHLLAKRQAAPCHLVRRARWTSVTTLAVTMRTSLSSHSSISVSLPRFHLNFC